MNTQRQFSSAPALLIALALLLLPLGGAAAQNRAAGAFQSAYPEASNLLTTFHANRAAVYAALLNGSGGQLPNGMYAQLTSNLDGVAEANPSSGLGSRADEVITRARGLHRQLLDIYSGPEGTDRRGAAEQAIDAYLARAETALPAQAKDRSIIVALAAVGTAMDHSAHEAHAGHDPEVHDEHLMDPAGSGAFNESHAEINRLLWAQQWLEIATFEPLFRAANAGGQGDGVGEVVRRFHARLADPSDPRLSMMPTVPAISPELTTRHPRAAMILDNLYLLEMALLNQLSSGTAADRAQRIERTLAAFTDADQYAVDDVDWLVASLRMSVFLQGGPALGVMDRLDRNVGNLGDHRVRGGHLIMPGS